MRNYEYTSITAQKWDLATVNLIGKIHESKGRTEVYIKQDPKGLSRLAEISKEQSGEGSNAIDGINVTNARIKKLIADKANHETKKEEEVLGYCRLFDKINNEYKDMTLNQELILQMHKELYYYRAVAFAGRFKKNSDIVKEIPITCSNGQAFTFVDAALVPESIDNICSKYNEAIAEGTIDPLLLIPAFIHDFICISPFCDANGRISRLLTLLLLNKAGYNIGKYISIEKRINDTKDNYFKAIGEAATGWHDNVSSNESFIKYMLEAILGAYSDFENRTSIGEEKLAATETVLEAVLKMEGTFSKKNIMEICPSLSKTSIERALTKYYEEGMLTREGKGPATKYTRKSE